MDNTREKSYKWFYKEVMKNVDTWKETVSCLQQIESVLGENNVLGGIMNTFKKVSARIEKLSDEVCDAEEQSEFSIGLPVFDAARERKIILDSIRKKNGFVVSFPVGTGGTKCLCDAVKTAKDQVTSSCSFLVVVQGGGVIEMQVSNGLHQIGVNNIIIGDREDFSVPGVVQIVDVKKLLRYDIELTSEYLFVFNLGSMTDSETNRINRIDRKVSCCFK